jgi:hypothetical protein
MDQNFHLLRFSSSAHLVIYLVYQLYAAFSRSWCDAILYHPQISLLHVPFLLIRLSSHQVFFEEAHFGIVY